MGKYANRVVWRRRSVTREENEENAAPQALPGARTRATPQRYVLLCYVLPCSVMLCSVLVHPVLFCSVLFWASLTNPTKLTQTNTTSPQHHTTATQWGPTNAIRHRGRRGKMGKPAPKAPGGLIFRSRRRRENGNSAPKAPGDFCILTSIRETLGKSGCSGGKGRGRRPAVSGVSTGTTFWEPGHCGPRPPEAELAPRLSCPKFNDVERHQPDCPE
eukprot:gene12513-biopygen21482